MSMGELVATMLRRIQTLTLMGAMLALAACGDDRDTIRDEAYEEGFEAGAYEVCREIGGISQDIRNRLRACRGL